MTEFTKIKLKRMSETELLQRLKDDMQCGDCAIDGTTPPKGTRIVPPESTLFIVVDMPKDKGAIRIFEEKDDNYIGAVATEDAGYLIVVPWTSSWWFRASGSLTVGYIRAAERK
ncbi:hypothetical protein JDV02_001901 [Purpureocillium takamizusanense]|uniref:Uncharacterized protein n=1 Tax=Purpureocillium takamizusanense TaxID=2060973 RepID=A0A9Q8V804_9HYPO|nr:uncharacterized protein JDV02_001901 [Purpureocillium takamizusanense]UNI15364.1 hypothetical protein JDV02_001901 [Purpureocillium takamizusanense]